MSATFLNKHTSQRTAKLWLSRVVALGSQLGNIWAGPADYPPNLRMEWRFIVLRYLGMSFLAPTLPLLNLSLARLTAAYILMIAYAGFNVWVHVLLHRRSSWLRDGYVTSLGDGLIISAMVMIGGGFTSPFYILLFPTTIAAAMRFGYRPSLLVVGFYILMDAISLRVSPATLPGHQGDFLFRSGYLTLTALLSSYLWEQARVAEAALARQLARARALNESSRALNTSLQLDIVSRTVAEEARRLVNADTAMLMLGPEHDNMVVFAHSGHIEDTLAQQQERLVPDLVPASVSSNDFDTVRAITDGGLSYIGVRLNGRSGVTGQIVVARAIPSGVYSDADEELLRSFIDRGALAVENASLYKTIGDSSKDLQRAYAGLASAHQELLGVDEMKTNFIANVSHELRTPLTSIRAFSEILLSMDIDAETNREFVGLINTESERLTRLINDVLDITKIEAGYVEWVMEELDLTALLTSSTRTFRPLIEDKGLRLELNVPPALPLVHGNRDRIMQVVANLFGNAVKFTIDGAITLSAEVLNDEVHIRVSDTGIGIAAEDQNRIFEKFHQVGDTLTDKPKGTGLGLCICREIVTHHGGTMWVSSAPGQGSTFGFSLPCVPTSAEVIAQHH